MTSTPTLGRQRSTSDRSPRVPTMYIRGPPSYLGKTSGRYFRKNFQGPTNVKGLNSESTLTTVKLGSERQRGPLRVMVSGESSEVSRVYHTRGSDLH